MFNKLLAAHELKHDSMTQMCYNPFTSRYFTRNFDEEGGPLKREICENIDVYDNRLIAAAQDLVNTWVGPRPPPGDAGTNGTPPDAICTRVVTIYQQHGNPYCLAYSMASALFYCGFLWQAEGLYYKAQQISRMDFESALEEIRAYMLQIVPIIGQPIILGKRTNSNGRHKQSVSWQDLLNDITPFPTIVISRLSDGRTNHAFCIVDDLIFDSISQYALQLKWESVQWIFNDPYCNIHHALRFKQKYTPQGSIRDKKEKYKRAVVYHWDHPSRPSPK